MADVNYRYSIIPARAITDPTLKPRDLKILALLGRHTNKNGWCRRSQRTLAAEAKCVRSTVQASLDRLANGGYVQVRLEGIKGRAAPPEGSHPYRSHSYRVLLDLDDQQIQKAAARRARKIGHLSDTENRHHVPIVDKKSSENADEIRSAPGAGYYADEIKPDFFEDSEFSIVDESDESERVSAPYIEPSPCEPSPCEPLSKSESVSAESTGPSLSEFLAKWPTASTDSVGKINGRWSKLSIVDRQAAIDGITPFLSELKRNHRDHVIAGWKYLAERRWQLLAKSTTDGEIATCDCWSRDWWGVLFKKIEAGEPVRFMISYATQPGNKAWCGKRDQTATIDQLAKLDSYPCDGDVAKAWRPWFEEQDVRLPRWTERVWIFLPGPMPPTGNGSVWKVRI